jgi:hypothetical protein
MHESPDLERISGTAIAKPLDPDYFDLQLKFAEVVAAKTGVDLAHAVFTHTNFFMRLSFGTRHDLDENHPGWRQFAAELVAAADKSACVYRTYLDAPPAPPSAATPFGCFSVDPVGADGIVRCHFGNKEPGDASPLSAGRVAARRDELRALFAHVRERWPHARIVNGNSWLYHFESYRRLFPESFGASRSLLRHSPLIHGTSRWGQFLDFRGRVLREMRNNFLANLARVDAVHLCDAFPVPTYRTTAPVEDFYAFLALRPAHRAS